MLHLFFNAERMRDRLVLTPRMIKRDTRMIKERIKSYAQFGKDCIEISSRDTEWRTRLYWTPYFEDRGFSVTTRKSESLGDSIIIDW